MTAPSIKVYKDNAVLDRFKELLEVKTDKHLNAVIAEELFTGTTRTLGVNEEAVRELRSCDVVKIVESPIRLRIEFAQPGPLFNRAKPARVLRCNSASVK